MLRCYFKLYLKRTTKISVLKMESFFYQGVADEAMMMPLWEDAIVPEMKRSDFVPYVERELKNNVGSGKEVMMRMRSGNNLKMRMVELFRSNWRKTVQGRVPERERSFEHMVSERLRRQNQRQSYQALHAILPRGTKGDKISILTTAAAEIMKTQRIMEELQRTNRELNQRLAAKEHEKGVITCSVRMKVANPTSGIGSSLAALRCLNDMGSDIIQMQSQFSAQEFSVDLQIASNNTEEMVQKAVQKSLVEVEATLLGYFQDNKEHIVHQPSMP